jgi:hypothetical protein
MAVPRTTSARLTDGPKLNMVVWHLRSSVLRETPMPDARETLQKAELLRFIKKAIMNHVAQNVP